MHFFQSSSRFRQIFRSRKRVGRKALAARKMAGHQGLESLEPRLLLFRNVLNFGDAYHESISELSLPFLQESAIDFVNLQHSLLDVLGTALPIFDDDHFTGSNLQGSTENINNRYQDILENSDPEAFEAAAILQRFGQILHTSQDFYAHSNWIELGQTGLIDSNLGLWNVITPYSQVTSDILAVQGEDETPFVAPFGEATLSREGLKVNVDFGGGVRFDGLTSATFGPDDAPDNVAIGHGELNKDDPSRPNFGAAVTLAARQTQHEFQRLGNLICTEHGADGLEMLLEEVVKPDNKSQQQARHLIGVGGTDLVFVIDATGSMFDDIAAVQGAANEIVTSLFDSSPCSRVGIVLYRDFGDAFVTRTQLPLTSDREDIVAAINSISVDGGGDTPEAVHSGLIHAIESREDLGEWRQLGGVTKAVIQIGDAPPHNPEPSSQPTDTGFTYADVASRSAAGGIEIIGSALSPRTAAISAAVDDEGAAAFALTEEILLDAGFFEDLPDEPVAPIDIFAIAIGSDPAARSGLGRIAAENRGELFLAPTADEVVDAINDAIGGIGSDGAVVCSDYYDEFATADRIPGDVRVFLAADGWRVEGDHLDNAITFESDASGAIIVTGLGGTTINGEDSPFVVLEEGALEGKLRLRLMQGDDFACLNNFHAIGKVVVDAGTGIDRVVVGDLQAEGNVVLKKQRDNGKFIIDSVDVTGRLKIKAGLDPSAISIRDSSIGGRVDAKLGQGNDTFLAMDTTFHSDVSLIGNRGGDDFLLMNASIGGFLMIDSGKGGDLIDLLAVDVARLARFEMGGGRDAMRVTDSVFRGRFSVRQGTELDVLDLSGSDFQGKVDAKKKLGGQLVRLRDDNVFRGSTKLFGATGNRDILATDGSPTFPGQRPKLRNFEDLSNDLVDAAFEDLFDLAFDA